MKVIYSASGAANVVLPLLRGTNTTPCRNRRVLVPGSTNPNRLVNTSLCQGIRRSALPASSRLTLGMDPAKFIAGGTPRCRPQDPGRTVHTPDAPDDRRRSQRL